MLQRNFPELFIANGNCEIYILHCSSEFFPDKKVMEFVVKWAWQVGSQRVGDLAKSYSTIGNSLNYQELLSRFPDPNFLNVKFSEIFKNLRVVIYN